MRPEGLVYLCSRGYWEALSSMLTERGVSGALRVQDVTQPDGFATVARLADFLMHVSPS